MTSDQTQRAQQQAEDDAKKMGLVLLLLFRDQRGFGTHKIEYDETVGRFRIDGRLVSIKTIRGYLSKIEDRFGRRLLQITSDLENHRITFDQWKREFDDSISSMHLLAGALFLGSIAAAAANHYIQSQIDQQIQFADKFNRELLERVRLSSVRSPIPRGRFSGLPGGGTVSEIPPVTFQSMSSAQLRARARSYGRAVHVTATNTELQLIKFLGVADEARNILRAAEHCQRSQFDPRFVPICTELTQQGWMDINSMPPIGTRKCSIWCRCYIEYR